MSKTKLTDENAIAAYIKALKSTSIYRYPEYYMRVIIITELVTNFIVLWYLLSEFITGNFDQQLFPEHFVAMLICHFFFNTKILCLVFLQCRATFYIESFHNAILMYTPNASTLGMRHMT